MLSLLFGFIAAVWQMVLDGGWQLILAIALAAVLHEVWYQRGVRRETEHPIEHE